MTFEFSLQIFEKYSDIKFHEKFFQWEQSCSRRTDRHDAAKSRLSQFYERA